MTRDETEVERSLATWVWSVPRSVPQTVDFLVRHRVAQVAVGVGWSGAGPAQQELFGAVRDAGMECDALGGDPSWARDPALATQWAARAVVGQTCCIHLDVEPWTLPEWPDQSADLLAGLVEVIHRSSELGPVDVDLPAWLARDHPGPAYELVCAAQRVTVLAYRDRAPSIEEESAAACALAVRATRPYRIGVDTLPSALPHTTFADDGSAVLDRELAVLNTRLDGRPGYRGAAIHDLAGWRALTRARAAGIARRRAEEE